MLIFCTYSFSSNNSFKTRGFSIYLSPFFFIIFLQQDTIIISLLAPTNEIPIMYSSIPFQIKIHALSTVSVTVILYTLISFRHYEVPNFVSFLYRGAHCEYLSHFVPPFSSLISASASLTENVAISLKLGFGTAPSTTGAEINPFIASRAIS